jgi:hypothetical protein
MNYREESRTGTKERRLAREVLLSTLNSQLSTLLPLRQAARPRSSALTTRVPTPDSSRLSVHSAPVAEDFARVSRSCRNGSVCLGRLVMGN